MGEIALRFLCYCRADVDDTPPSGRAREVVVPRLPSRRDEIGTLARALSDMTHALRERIDAGDHFAADVTPALKNPIASVRSAIEGLGRVKGDEQIGRAHV